MSKSFFIDNNCINIDKVFKKCMKFECISFDVFDTLIKRNLGNPDNIFNILDKIAKDSFDIKKFYDLRKITEEQLRKNKKYITLDEIYDGIGIKVTKKIAQFLKNKEIELELNYCQPNYEMIELYKKLRKKNKKIIAISDMYLSSKDITKMLEKCGYFLDKLYVSCECRAKKNDGTLFKYVLEHDGYNKKNIIHIGDNYRADILGARKIGINTIHIKKETIKFNKKKFIKEIQNIENYNVFYSIINNNLKNQDTYYKKVGFALFGPLVYNYSIWLNKKCEDNHLNRILFFARDGFVLKKSFELLYKNKYDISYVYFSRRAIRIPYSIISPSYENIMKFFPKTKVLTMKVYFENFGLDPNKKKYKDLLKKYNLTMDTSIYYNDLIKDSIYREIFNYIYNDLLEVAEKEYKILKKYLKQEKIYGNVAIVDIGWHNSMQYYLSEIAKYNNYNLNMFGFYIGKMHGEKKVDYSEGFISDKDNSEYSDSALSFIGLMESVFLAIEGSTKTYKIGNNDEILPVLLNYEYDYNDAEYKAFTEIQEGINNFINIVKDLEYLDLFNLSGFDSYIPIKSFGTKPYLKDIKHFSKFRYFSEELTYFSNPKSLIYYIFHMNIFKLDLYKARWKIGFMKELFKLNLPYYKFYMKMRRK